MTKERSRRENGDSFFYLCVKGLLITDDCMPMT